MKPGPVSYHDPETVHDAVALLESHGDEAKVIAGGQSLIPLLNMRLSSPSVLVDLNRIRDLDYYWVEAGRLTVGALCRHRDIELDPEIRWHCGAIADAVAMIGHVAIRNRGTVVGSVCHADAAAEWPALAVLLDATITARGPRGVRSIPASDFFDGHFTTALSPDEIATEIRFRLPEGTAGSAFVELARRHGDFALAGVGASVTLTEDGTVASVRLVASGVDSVPRRLVAAEQALTGQVPGDAAVAAAGDAARGAVDPPDDIHAPAAYRRHLVDVLTRRALTTAIRRAKEGGHDV